MQLVVSSAVSCTFIVMRSGAASSGITDISGVRCFHRIPGWVVFQTREEKMPPSPLLGVRLVPVDLSGCVSHFTQQAQTAGWISRNKGQSQSEV